MAITFDQAVAVGLVADRPAADSTKVGRLYAATDTGIVYRDNGTTWDDYASLNDTDANLLNRANHTGTQLLSTISDAGTAAALNVPASGNAASGEVVQGNDTRLDLAATTHTATSKATPVDADELPIVDSAASNVLKKLTWSNMQATLKAYFDTLYAAVTHTHVASDITDSGTTGRAVLQAATQAAARTAIGAGTAATYNVPASGNAASGEVVLGSDTRLSSSASIPASAASVADDFIGGATASGSVGELGWSYISGTVTVQTVSGHPGVIRRDTGATSGTNAHLSLHATNASLDCSDTFDLTVIFRLNTNDSSTLLRIGLFGSVATNTPTEFIGLEKLAADTDWFGTVRATSVSTRTAALAAADTNWHKIRIRRTNSTTIGFTLDGGTEVTNSGTNPSGNLCPMIGLHIQNSAAASKTVDLDYYGIAVTGLSR